MKFLKGTLEGFSCWQHFALSCCGLFCTALPRDPEMSVKQCAQHWDVFLLTSALEKKQFSVVDTHFCIVET